MVQSWFCCLHLRGDNEKWVKNEKLWRKCKTENPASKIETTFLKSTIRGPTWQTGENDPKLTWWALTKPTKWSKWLPSSTGWWNLTCSPAKNWKMQNSFITLRVHFLKLTKSALPWWLLKNTANASLATVYDVHVLWCPPTFPICHTNVRLI